MTCVIMRLFLFWRQINVHNEKCINWNDAEIREFLTIHAEAEIVHQFSETVRGALYTSHEMSRVFAGSLRVVCEITGGVNEPKSDDPGKNLTGHIFRVFYRMAVWKRLMIALSAVTRISGPIALILLWGPSKSHSVRGGCAPQRTSFWVPFNRWALKLSSISWPASSKNTNGFHQLPALSASKKTFTIGKTNTDNNHIDFWGFFNSPKNRHLETDHTWTYSVLSCFTFEMSFKIFLITMLQE